MDVMSENPDLGGERACWLDEVCPSCGGMGGHRAGCDVLEGRAAAETSEPSGLSPSDVSRLTGRTPSPYTLRPPSSGTSD